MKCKTERKVWLSNVETLDAYELLENSNTLDIYFQKTYITVFENCIF